MKVWAIRIKGSDKYLQLHRSSNTYYDATNKPRIRFHPTKRGAVNALSAWLRGMVDFRDGFSYSKIESRKRENMEIVEFDLTEVVKS